jgi:hypothetical protein
MAGWIVRWEGVGLSKQGARFLYLPSLCSLVSLPFPNTFSLTNPLLLFLLRVLNSVGMFARPLANNAGILGELKG